VNTWNECSFIYNCFSGTRKRHLEVVEGDQTNDGCISIAEHHERTLAITTPFEIEDSYYVKEKRDNSNFFWWNPNVGFTLKPWPKEK